MEVTIDISERNMARLKDITEEDTNQRALSMAIAYTLDNY